MIGYILVSIITAIICLVCYHLLVKWMGHRKTMHRDLQHKLIEVELQAREMLTSEDAADITDFASKNARFISLNTLQKLLGRIAELRPSIVNNEIVRNRIQDIQSDKDEIFHQ